jgi:hypothetical protein
LVAARPHDPKSGDLPASEILACRNGLLHLPTGKLLPLTPRFFTCNGLTFDYDPKAPEPVVFLSFLDQLWEHDPEQIPLLQEVFGVLLTPDTSMQKFFLILGPPRSGKGTIVRLLTQLVGKRNTCSPTLDSLGSRFGLETALGKTLATVSDMRLGKRTDKQGIVANILRITGEDDVDVERKHVGGAWTGKLAIRIVICSNQLPPLPDVSGALVARLVALTLERSFLNDEDRTLDGETGCRVARNPQLEHRWLASTTGARGLHLDGCGPQRGRSDPDAGLAAPRLSARLLCAGPGYDGPQGRGLEGFPGVRVAPRSAAGLLVAELLPPRSQGRRAVPDHREPASGRGQAGSALAGLGADR